MGVPQPPFWLVVEQMKAAAAAAPWQHCSGGGGQPLAAAQGQPSPRCFGCGSSTHGSGSYVVGVRQVQRRWWQGIGPQCMMVPAAAARRMVNGGLTTGAAHSVTARGVVGLSVDRGEAGAVVVVYVEEQ